MACKIRLADGLCKPFDSPLPWLAQGEPVGSCGFGIRDSGFGIRECDADTV
jgi:hypothetical protein